MSVGDPNPTVCPYCGNQSVYPKQDRADRIGWVWVKWCTVCQRLVSP